MERPKRHSSAADAAVMMIRIVITIFMIIFSIEFLFHFFLRMIWVLGRISLYLCVALLMSIAAMTIIRARTKKCSVKVSFAEIFNEIISLVSWSALIDVVSLWWSETKNPGDSSKGVQNGKKKGTQKKNKAAQNARIQDAVLKDSHQRAIEGSVRVQNGKTKGTQSRDKAGNARKQVTIPKYSHQGAMEGSVCGQDIFPAHFLVEAMQGHPREQDTFPIRFHVGGLWKPHAANCLNQCLEGKSCPNVHYAMPYQWQYTSYHTRGEWKSFSEEYNLALEISFCDPKFEGLMKTHLNHIIEIDEDTLHPREYDVSVDVNSMTLSVEPVERFFPEIYLSGRLRRLSTPPCSIYPNHLLSTKWKWYWEDNGNVWCLYDKNHLGENLQELIEQAFLNQNRPGHKFNFKIRDQEYCLIFRSERGMHQINVQYGTIRKVKRRPERPVYLDELNGLNSLHPEFRLTHPDSVNVNQLATTRPILHMSRESDNGAVQPRVPQHWSPMPSNEKYTRVPLELFSKEFTEVEQLFLKSMHNAVIEKIDRLQNPFMWEKYQRKKDNMMGLAHGKTCNVNENKLFHGTSPDAVEAICKQNFDWRVNGKNATVYGQGSYFAVDASYSHNYAKEDGTRSRFMFLAKVLAGSYTKGEPSFRRPPPKQPWNPTSDLYDSCVDNEAEPKIFVVFETDQCYPEYVIQYSSAQPFLDLAVSAPRMVPLYPRATPLSLFTNFSTGQGNQAGISRKRDDECIIS